MKPEKLNDVIKKHEIWLKSDGRKGVQANFEGMDLQQALFDGKTLDNAIFKGTNLTRAKFVNCSLQGVDFSDSDLSYADCGEAHFVHANLSGANLSGAILLNSQFQRTNLTNANFFSARMYKAKFCDLSAEKVCFENVDLTGATFENVVLSEPDFLRTNITNAAFFNVTIISGNMDKIVGIARVSDLAFNSTEQKFIGRKPQILFLEKISAVTLLASYLFFAIVAIATVTTLFLKWQYDIEINAYIYVWVVFGLISMLASKAISFYTLNLVRRDAIGKEMAKINSNLQDRRQ